jgi:hypothetical protein
MTKITSVPVLYLIVLRSVPLVMFKVAIYIAAQTAQLMGYFDQQWVQQPQRGSGISLIHEYLIS